MIKCNTYIICVVYGTYLQSVVGGTPFVGGFPPHTPIIWDTYLALPLQARYRTSLKNTTTTTRCKIPARPPLPFNSKHTTALTSPKLGLFMKCCLREPAIRSFLIIYCSSGDCHEFFWASLHHHPLQRHNVEFIS